LTTTDQSWSLEKIQAMRQELLEGGLTLRQVAQHEGVSLQRIQQLVGRLDRGRSRSRAQRERVQLLGEAGHSDAEIAEALKLSPAYVSELRRQSGIRHPNRLKWTRDLIIQTARAWYDRYGFTPTSTDWNPTKAKRMGHHERARRFYEFGGPYTTTVVTRFGSWSAMIAESRLPPTSVRYAKRTRSGD
jgi:DNA-binding CsgD family transcriptional regulator